MPYLPNLPDLAGMNKMGSKKSDHENRMSNKRVGGREKSAKTQVLPVKKVIVIMGQDEIGAELVFSKRTGELLTVSLGSWE